ncbi:MAG: ferritin [Bacteroidetes bacterium]|nr:ferritin [Bacteroidota bacterium]HET6244405.1 ferritin [Bacteroidia bacterium]
MLISTIEKKLNEQVELEGYSSQYYLSMASWAENNGLNGVSNFLYRQSDEERLHMLKLVKYINERGGKAIIPSLEEPPREFESLPKVFEMVHAHEIVVSTEINKLVEACLSEKDYTTQNFLQWYVAEQIEEEALAKNILDKLKLIGNDKGGLYLFDRDLDTLTGSPVGKV